MRRLFPVVLASLALALSGCASQSGSGGASAISDVEGQSVYTQRNMWFHEGVHKTTNYHVSTMLPVNSQVTITDTSSERIMIKTSEGTEYTIVNIAEYTKEDIEGIYNRYFGSSKVDLSRFSAQERSAIEDGRLVKGMSKEAVLVARGYPPAHKTPSTDSDQWRFWKSAHNTRLVYFDDGKISRIKD